MQRSIFHNNTKKYSRGYPAKALPVAALMERQLIPRARDQVTGLTPIPKPVRPAVFLGERLTLIG